MPGAKGFSPYRDELRTPLLIMMGMVVLVMAMADRQCRQPAAGAGRNPGARILHALCAGRDQRAGLPPAACRRPSARHLERSPGSLHRAPRACRLSSPGWQGVIRTRPSPPALDWRVLLFTAAAALTASLLFSLAPALQFWNPRLAESFKQQTGTGSGGALQFRRTCVALQIGFSLLLIVGAGLFVRTIQNLRNVDPGFATDHLLTFRLAPEYAGYPPTQIAPVEQRALEALAALPGVRCRRSHQ